MPRQKNTKPTNIYWLYDMRPETIAGGYQNGKPFYCGKTVQKPERRLRRHHYSPSGDAGPRILECGAFIRISITEIVPADQDWCARERFWIHTMRLLWPGCCLNLTDGGDGAPGYVHTAEFRAKRRAEYRGRKMPPDQRAKMTAAVRIAVSLPEYRAKMSAIKKGKKLSPGHAANVAAAARLRNRSPEHRAKVSASTKNRPIGYYIKLAAPRRGKKLSLEHRAKLSVAAKARCARS